MTLSALSVLHEQCPKVTLWVNGIPQNGLLRKPQFHTSLSSPFFATTEI